MALGKDVVVSRRAGEKIVLENQAFARWMARRSGVSARALASAINLLSDGIVAAMAEGYAVRLYRVGTFECREVPPRRRYHRLKKEMYTSPATTIVHFKKSSTLNTRVKTMADARLAKLTSEPFTRPVVTK